MINGSMANGTMTNLSHALAANDTVITGTMANDTMTDIAALNDTSPNATTTAEEKVEDALPPRGMIRVRFVHATVGAGDLYVDHISISSSDGAIGGHFDDIINGECPYFARTAERHPSVAKNYFEANRTDLWPSDSATTSGVNVERPAAKLHAVDNLTIHCGYGGELRESATGLCTGDVLFTAACTSVLIALGSVSAGVCCFVLLAYRCIRRSRRIDDAEMAVDVKLGFVDFQDRRCPPELRARTHGQMLVVKKFGEVHPEHRLMPWQTERLKDDNDARQKKEKKEIESMQKRSVVRSIMNLARHAIQGPAKPARVYPIALEPAVGVSRAYHTKIGGDEDLDDENEYAVKMAKSKMDPERHTNITTYRVPRCPSREEVLAPPAKIMEIRDTSLRWESPIHIDLVKDVVKSGIGGRDGGTFPYYVPRHGFFDRGRSDVLSLILNVDGVEYRVEQQPREAFSVPRAPRRLFTKIFKEHHLVGEIDKELAPWSEVEDLFLGTWRNVAQRPACRLRDDEGTTLCVVHAAKGRGLRITPWHDEYAEIFKLVDGDGDACGTVEMRYKSWMGFLTPQAASIDMRPCNDKETEMLLAFGLVFGLAYQRNQRRDSFPSIRGVLVPKRRQGHTYEPNPKREN